jgi:beta-N-acetylglucosaminidase
MRTNGSSAMQIGNSALGPGRKTTGASPGVEAETKNTMTTPKENGNSGRRRGPAPAIVGLIIAAWCLFPEGARGSDSAVEGRGIDLQGGAGKQFGATYYHRDGVNYVYARPTAEAAVMTGNFPLHSAPSEPQFLFLEAMDDDAPGPCHVRVTLNGRELLSGPSGFPNAHWFCRRLAIPAGTLQVGTNTLSVLNEEPRGSLGAPPWFMVARWALAGADYKMSTIEAPALHVRLPAEARPFPEPLAAGRSGPGFKFRGTKGWNWTPEQYLAEIPYLKKFKMNFLMNCYSSMFTSKPGEPWRNEWWKPMTDARKQAYARVIRACREQGVTFCFAFHPQIASPRPLDPASAKDLDQLYQHYAWAQSQGVHWFSVSLDDVSWGSGGAAAGGAAHAHVANVIIDRLRATDPDAQMIFCPVPYWGDGTDPKHRAYLEAVARDLVPDVYVFWTGDGVVTPRITRRAAESYRGIVKHRLFLWDNYPVNDANSTLHLGPVRGRDPDLNAVVDGYMSNPMASQNEINRIPLATCADYAYNPWAYDPARSIGQAILHLADTNPQRELLKDLVETYPGFLVTGGGTGTNPVRGEFGSLLAAPEARSDAERLRMRLEDVVARLGREFPGQFPAARKTVALDVQWMKDQAGRVSGK